VTTAEVVREPLYRTAPDCRSSFGDLAARVGVELGLPPDEEQRAALDAIFAESEPAIPRYRHACIVATRQQMKSATLTIAAATDLLLLGVPGAVWTAHQSKTATKSYEDLSRRIRQHDEYREVCAFRNGRGEEAIYLVDQPEVSLEYRARSGGSGRGFTTGRLTLDEALYLRAGDIGALAPTMLTRREGQIRYGSSAGLAQSDVLRSLRDDGRAGTDPGLWYVEYGSERRPCEREACAHEITTVGCALDDRDLWWQSCPAMWCGRVREDDVADLRRRMPPLEFAREVLGWWDQPLHGAAGVFGGAWPALADIAKDRARPVSFGVAVSPDRDWSAVAVAWQRPDGNTHVMLADYRSGTAWVQARCEKLRGDWGGTFTASTTARGLVPGADEPQQGEQARAHTHLDDLVQAARLRHDDQPALNTAVSGARWKPYGDTRMFDRKGDLDISPLDAAALAVAGLNAQPTADFIVL
jgi:hypothetical protein